MVLPVPYKIRSVTRETHDVFSLTLSSPEKKETSFLPGQFNMLFVFGYGEVAISISGDPFQKEELVHTIRSVGAVTQAMEKLQKGDEIGVRGPFGTHWPFKKKECDVLIIAGGIGMAPLRPAVHYLIKHRQDYKNVTLLYGSRSPSDLIYKNELALWQKQGMEVKVSVDRGDEHWKGSVGVIPSFISKHLPNPQNTLVLICGPEVMIQFTIQELLRKNVDPHSVYLSMERNMQCAVGFCGHCQYGPHFLCKDGPVFSYEQLKSWLTIKEL